MNKDFNVEYSHQLFLENEHNKTIIPGLITGKKRMIKPQNTCKKKCEPSFFPQLPIDQYPISREPFTEISKKPQESLKYIQHIGVRYLEPPEPDKPGDLIIRKLPDKQIAPGAPVFIRQTPPKPRTPSPLFIREPPPSPLPKVERQVIEIPGKTLPPPPRRVIVEKLPPIPPKPRTIIIDKWLPQKELKRQVIIEKVPNPTPLYQSQKNILINWESPNVEIERRITNLGVYKVDPDEYIKKYGNSFSHTEEAEQILKSIKMPIYHKHQMSKSSKSLNKHYSFDSIESFSQIANKKRVSFQK
ncbi:hypothetical protein BpHYR1_010534 [Brachionus plicatilis]|uniref:Uncharacterized protein n=1 Tax=Brachionus plicatilis TaxID=10195 RepID=A0A3M7PZ78_BRAPC|nr:hypothetical protein BpHYR1_010534 [Brachionus plicatilis]